MPSMGGSQAGDDVSGQESTGTSGGNGTGTATDQTNPEMGAGAKSQRDAIEASSQFGGFDVDTFETVTAMQKANLSRNFANPMNIHNPIDRAMAGLGIDFGLPPDPSLSSPAAVMSGLFAAVPGLNTLSRTAFSIMENPTSLSMQDITASAIGKAVDHTLGATVPGFGFASKVAGLFGVSTPGDLAATSISESITDPVNAPAANVSAGFASTPAETIGGFASVGGNSDADPATQPQAPANQIVAASAQAPQNLIAPPPDSTIDITAAFPEFTLLTDNPFDFLQQTKAKL